MGGAGGWRSNKVIKGKWTLSVYISLGICICALNIIACSIIVWAFLVLTLTFVAKYGSLMMKMQSVYWLYRGLLDGAFCSSLVDSVGWDGSHYLLM